MVKNTEKWVLPIYQTGNIEMKKIQKVVLKYKNRPEAKEHSITASVLEGSKPIKQKHFSIGRDWDFDSAYEEGVKAATELAKQYKLVFTKPSKAELKDSVSNPRNKKSPSPGQKIAPAIVNSTSQLLEKFGNVLAFRAFINGAVKLHGVEKIEEVLTSGLEEIAVAKEALINERRIRATVNRKIAEAILSARDLGVNMDAPNNEVADLIGIILDDRARKSNRKPNGYEGKKYVLNGESWDGVGHAPASFAKWLNEDENRSIEDLAVSNLVNANV